MNRVKTFGLFLGHVNALGSDDAQTGVFQHLGDRTGDIAAGSVGLND